MGRRESVIIMSGCAEVLIQMLSTDKGGRLTPIFVGYRPHFRVCGGDGEYLGVEFVDGPSGPVHPGETTSATVKFMYEPQVSYESLTVGSEFEIMEGGKRVGTGKVTRT